MVGKLRHDRRQTSRRGSYPIGDYSYELNYLDGRQHRLVDLGYGGSSPIEQASEMIAEGSRWRVRAIVQSNTQRTRLILDERDP